MSKCRDSGFRGHNTSRIDSGDTILILVAWGALPPTYPPCQNWYYVPGIIMSPEFVPPDSAAEIGPPGQRRPATTACAATTFAGISTFGWRVFCRGNVRQNTRPLWSYSLVGGMVGVGQPCYADPLNTAPRVGRGKRNCLTCRGLSMRIAFHCGACYAAGMATIKSYRGAVPAAELQCWPKAESDSI